MTALAAVDPPARARRRFRRLSPDEAATLLAGGRSRLVDVRPPAARVREGTVPGAHLVERAAFRAQLDPCAPGRLAWVAVDRPVVVICSRGVTSGLAAADLLDLGYLTVYDVEGGAAAWKGAGWTTA